MDQEIQPAADSLENPEDSTPDTPPVDPTTQPEEGQVVPAVSAGQSKPFDSEAGDMPAPTKETSPPNDATETKPEPDLCDKTQAVANELTVSPSEQPDEVHPPSVSDDEQASDQSAAEPLTQESLIRQLLTAPIPSADTTIIQQIDTSALEEAQTNLSHQIFDLAERVNTVSSTNTAIVTDLHKVSEETEQLLHWSQHVQVTTALSKIFQAIAISVLLVLLGGLIWLGILQNQTQARLNAAETALADALKLQQKRLADYDKHFAELVGKELQSELETTHKSTLQEQMNKLRGGNAEQRIYRRNSGDWFVVAGKSEHHVVDPEIIEVLNQAFVKSGKQLVTRSPMPPHKVWGLLKSNGHGGTEVVMTSEITP